MARLGNVAVAVTGGPPVARGLRVGEGPQCDEYCPSDVVEPSTACQLTVVHFFGEIRMPNGRDSRDQEQSPIARTLFIHVIRNCRRIDAVRPGADQIHTGNSSESIRCQPQSRAADRSCRCCL
jgi:hypothetical protein